MKKTVLDTNIYLEYKYFANINWKELMSDEVVILVPMSIIKELDNYKYDTNNKKSKRAKSLIKLFHDISDEKIPNEINKIPVELILEEPDKTIFDKYSLDKNKPDDCILASILNLPDYKDCTLVTGDLNMKLKAKSLKINVIRLDDNYVDRDELDEKDKEIKKLNKEIETLKNKNPVLYFCFDNDETYIDKLPNNITVKEEDINSKYNSILGRVTPTNQQLENMKLSVINKPIPIMLPVTYDDIEKFNSEVMQYHSDYKEYLERLVKYEKWNSLNLALNFRIHNKGFVPANSIDLTLFLPKHLEIVEGNILNEPIEPPSPIMNYRLREEVKKVLENSEVPLKGKPIVKYKKPDEFKHISSGFQKKTNKDNLILTYGYHQLKHNYFVHVHPLIIRFKKVDDIKSFQISYSLLADNTPISVTGILHIKINKNKNNKD